MKKLQSIWFFVYVISLGEVFAHHEPNHSPHVPVPMPVIQTYTPDKDFYGDCNTKFKLCGGIGPGSGSTNDCITKKNCRYAGSVSENATHFILDYYYHNEEINLPCTITGMFHREVEFTPKLKCKAYQSLEDFSPFLYRAKGEPCISTSKTNGRTMLTTRFVEKATVKSNCEASNLTIYYIEGKPGVPLATEDSGNHCENYKASLQQGLQRVRKYDGIFYTNVVSEEEELWCPGRMRSDTESGSEGGFATSSTIILCLTFCRLVFGTLF